MEIKCYNNILKTVVKIKVISNISNTSQNDLISFWGQFTTELVVRKVKDNQFFSILAHDASDSSNQK